MQATSLTSPVIDGVRPVASVGAVVLGGDYVGLGVVRSVGRHGIPVCVIDDELSVSRFSRYTTHWVRVPDLRDEARTVQVLLQTCDRLGLDGWVLLPTRDEITTAIARNAEVLGERFRISVPSWDTVRWASDKRNTYRLAEELDIPIPATAYPRSLDEVDAIELEFPVIVKPAIKARFVYATKAKAWRADSRDQLRMLYRQAAEIVGPEEVMVQSLIPGNGDHQFAYCAFFKDGEVISSMTARRARQHPPEIGRATTYAETVDAPALEEPSLRFLRAIDYYGIVELEYKRDPRDGQYKLLDVNPRAWGYHTLGLSAGVDFPYLLFADQLGWAVESSRARPGVRWIRLLTDLPTSVGEVRRGHLDWRVYLRSLPRFDVEAVFCRDDPLPGVVELALVPYLYRRRGA